MPKKEQHRELIKDLREKVEAAKEDGRYDIAERLDRNIESLI